MQYAGCRIKITKEEREFFLFPQSWLPCYNLFDFRITVLCKKKNYAFKEFYLIATSIGINIDERHYCVID